MKLASAGKSWFVIRCSIRSEEKAAENLRLAGFETYLPRYRKDIQNRKSKETYKTITLPLIPPYLFVAMQHGKEHFGFARSCEGVDGFLGVNGIPARINGADVERLQIMETDMQFDNTRAARIHRKEEAATRKENMERTYTAGRVVKINSGPFAEFDAVVQKVSKRGNIVVAIRLFGGESEIEVEAEQLSTAA